MESTYNCINEQNWAAAAAQLRIVMSLNKKWTKGIIPYRANQPSEKPKGGREEVLCLMTYSTTPRIESISPSCSELTSVGQKLDGHPQLLGGLQEDKVLNQETPGGLWLVTKKTRYYYYANKPGGQSSLIQT